jgi:DNA-binding LacI/PurR family transcriptional regulator
MAQRPIRLIDVAKAAGVSQGTASNAFNRPEVVRPEVRAHVAEVARALGYRGPNLRGRLLRAGKVNAIGIAVDAPMGYFFNDPFARVLMTGIADACDAHGAGLALVSAAGGERGTWNIDTALVDGLILLCLEGGERLIELARERQLPFVALEHNSDDASMPSVGIDNVAAARLAAEHLLALGHRRFAILSSHEVALAREPRPYLDSRGRSFGYLRALEEAGIDPARVPVIRVAEDASDVPLAMTQLFGGPSSPTALLVMSDLSAMAAIDWLRANGRRVPEDVSVVGFDGVPEGQQFEPPLTTVAQPIAEIGQRAVERLLLPRAPTERELLPVELLVGGSTGPAPAR